ncbi:MAG: hypothetical protein ACTSO7_15090, partial [Candidatus Heimdallarchaeota archaeon]
LPRDVAMLGYETAVNPVRVPAGFDNWGSAVVIDVDLMNAPTSTVPGFKDIFDSFTEMLLSEFSINYTVARDTLMEIRNNCTVWGLDSSESMMVDIYHYAERVIAYNQSLNNPDTLVYAELLLDRLTPGMNKVVMSEYYWWEDSPHLNGMSICYPDTSDMFQNYLWPNMYENLKISQETSWWLLMDEIYPTYDMKNFRIPDLYQIWIHPLDPVSQLHVLFDNDLVSEPLHVGLSKDFHYEPGMGIELGIAGAEFHTDLQFGNSMIYIPAASLQVGLNSLAAIDNSLKILVKTGATTDALRTVNLTVKHVTNDEILWEENLIKEVEPGTVVSCEITPDDNITELIIEGTPLSTTKLFGPEKKTKTIFTFFTTGLFIAIIIRRKKKEKK